MVFLGGSDGREFTCNAGDLSSIPGLGKSPGEGNGYPLQYSCLGNPKDRGAWWATVHGVTKSLTQLSKHTHTHTHTHTQTHTYRLEMYYYFSYLSEWYIKAHYLKIHHPVYFQELINYDK